MSTKRHAKFPKITQLRNAVTAIRAMSTYTGNDENGDAMFDHLKPKPILEFTGTVKLHGTNAGFAFFVESKRDIFQKMFDQIRSDLKGSIYPDDTITIYGEWAGKGIQKGVGISQIEKSFFIFGVKISPVNVVIIEDINDDPEIDHAYWIKHTHLSSPEDRIYNIHDFKTFKIDINFNHPERIQNTLIEYTEEVERECPVSKELGAEENLIGEGIVWIGKYNDSQIRFKVKGEKHSSSKVKKLAEVDIEKVESIQKFVEYAVTRNRFEQALKEVYGDEELNMKKFGDLIRWIIKDVMTEEMDVLVENKLEPKEVNSTISAKVKEFWFKMDL